MREGRKADPRRFDVHGQQGSVSGPDQALGAAADQTLASGSWGFPSLSGEIKLWNVGTGKERATLKGDRDGVLSVAYSPDGKTLASGSQDQTIKLWDIPAARTADK
jgi:WD40 repeat protein